MAFTDNQTQHSTSKDEKKEAEIYLNPGLEMTNPVTGEKQFVSLPWGVPVDTQSFKVKNTSDDGYNAMQMLKSNLLEGLQARAAQLAPEEEIIIPLQLVMRRRKAPVSKQEVESAGAAQLEDFFAILNGKPKSEPVVEADDEEEEAKNSNPFTEMFAKAS